MLKVKNVALKIVIKIHNLIIKIKQIEYIVQNINYQKWLTLKKEVLLWKYWTRCEIMYEKIDELSIW